MSIDELASRIENALAIVDERLFGSQRCDCTDCGVLRDVRAALTGGQLDGMFASTDGGEGEGE